MSHSDFKFEVHDAKSIRRPRVLLIGITSPSFGGKTYSALRMAMGIRRVIPGHVYLIDTEGERGLQYQDEPGFEYKWVPLKAPFSPAHYQAAIEHCLGLGASVVIVDQMSYEHNGEGGVLDEAEAYIERYLKRNGIDPESRDGWTAREKMKWASMIDPKMARRRLKQRIIDAGAACVFIFLYRAREKVKPGAGGKPVDMGLQAETTSDLPYEMTVRFLLEAGSDGHPNLSPDTEFEKKDIKMPSFFRSWFQKGLQLDEALGERLARWSREGTQAPPAVSPPPRPTAPTSGPAPATPAAPRAAGPKAAGSKAASAEYAEQWLARFERGGIPRPLVLAKIGRASARELTVDDLRLFTDWERQLREKATTKEDLFPDLVALAAAAPGPDEGPPEPGTGG